MLQYILGKIDEFGWWDLEGISADAGMQFTSTEFQGKCKTHSVCLTLEALEHHKMNRQVKVKWRQLSMIAYLLMVHASFGSLY